jgi:hypothetical protein
MYVDMWIDLLKQTPLDGKSCYPVMEGWLAYLGFHVGFKNHTHGIRVVGTVRRVSR